MVRVTAVLSPLAVAGVLVPFRATFSNTEGALLMVVVVVGVAAFGDRVAGILATVSSALWFDFFLTRPYERLAISHRQDIETTVLLFVVGLAVTELTARGRLHRIRAGEQSLYLKELGMLSRMMAEGGDTRVALARTEAVLSSLLELRGCRYEPSPPSGRSALVLPDGSVVLAGVTWPTLPGKEVDLPITYRGREFGRFVLSPTPGKEIPVERRKVASALANEMGAVLAGSERPAARPAAP
jgi:hypothetical protein